MLVATTKKSAITTESYEWTSEFILLLIDNHLPAIVFKYKNVSIDYYRELNIDGRIDIIHSHILTDGIILILANLKVIEIFECHYLLIRFLM